MENATNSKRVAPSTRRRSVSSSARTGPAGLVDYVVTDFLDACDSRDEASLSQLVRHAGTKAGELLEVLYRSQLALDGALDADAYARLITRVIQACGCSASSQITDSGLIRVVTQDCPYYLQDSQACNLVQSIIGTIGARNFDYAKVDLRHVGEVADKVCECRICLEPGRARQQPGLEYCDEYSSAQTHPATSNCLSSLSSTDSAGIGPQPLIVGRSRQMRRILGVLDTVAPTSATVLITGETGTGKECVARALHGLSERSDQEFIGVNCGTIPENLIESALFGHERGAFTSAHARHIGYFERANGSTLFLDEIDSLAPEAQVRLLRVLQEGLYERVGGRQILHSSARIVAATNAQLPTAIQDGRFRSDLYYRLNVVNMHIPPLRERPDDIPVLTELILARLNHRYRGCVTSLGRQAMRT